MSRDRRSHPRKRVDLPATYVIGEGGRVAVHLADMSLGGAYVEVEQLPPFGAKLTLYVTFPGGGEIAFDSIVRWTKPGGVGLQFGLLSARATYQVTEYIADQEEIPDSRLG